MRYQSREERRVERGATQNEDEQRERREGVERDGWRNFGVKRLM
jgi:hypothetical protein